jgi:hypothetical protein
MLRDARLGDGTNCEFGVFEILGPDEVRRATCIWPPVTRLVTQEVSLAFMLVEGQRRLGENVSALGRIDLHPEEIAFASEQAFARWPSFRPAFAHFASSAVFAFQKEGTTGARACAGFSANSVTV